MGIELATQFRFQDDFVSQILSKNGDYQTACFARPQAANPDALYDTFHTGAAGNVTFYSNPQVDELLEGIRTTADATHQADLVGSAQEAIVADVPTLPLVFDVFANISTTEVSGLPVPAPWPLGAIAPATLYRKQ